MIVSKKVETVWNNRNKKHYESKGYVFTKDRDHFLVDVVDLQPTSTIVVDVKCEMCGVLRKVKYYIALPREESGNLCVPCALKAANPKVAITKMNKRGSFLDKVTTLFSDDFLDKYWSSKNKLDPSTLCMGSKRKIWIKCQNTDYHDDYITTPGRFLRGARCPQCYNRDVHPADSLGQKMDNEYGSGYAESRWSCKNTISPFEVFPSSGKKFGSHVQIKYMMIIYKQCIVQRHRNIDVHFARESAGKACFKAR